MNENNNVNYGFDNTLCSVDVGSQVADGIDINRVCEGIDETKIEWIDAREKLPKKGTTLFGGEIYLVERHVYVPDWAGDGYKEYKRVCPARYSAAQKIWHIRLGEDTFDYCNALIDKLEVPHCLASVPRWAYMPGDKEDEDEM